MNLAQLPVGQKGRIARLEAQGPRKRRLMDMGVIVGEEVQVEKIAPLGDPIEVIIKDYRLSLRKIEAESVTVEVVL
ncbi:MAG: ferrous iron transport protein A [Methanosarcinales archaeon]|nr:ferrous iron transport protein A [Methanosarcinales archaeon]